MKDIIVTFTVVLALHKVVYLLWLSTFKDKGKRNSKNVCHGRHMVNSKSTMFSRNVTVGCYSIHKFPSSIIVHAFTIESDSQTVRQSNSQRVIPPDSQTVKQSNGQTVRQSDGRTVTQSHSQKVRESDCRVV